MCKNLCEYAITECDNKEFIKSQISHLFYDGDRQITKLTEKSQKFVNYIGFLYWVLSDEIIPDVSVIKNAFNETFSGNFDLYVCLAHYSFAENQIFKIEKSDLSADEISKSYKWNLLK